MQIFYLSPLFFFLCLKLSHMLSLYWTFPKLKFLKVSVSSGVGAHFINVKHSWVMKTLTTTKLEWDVEAQLHSHKVTHHTILCTFSNELFDVYCSYKEAKSIWDSMMTKYIAEDARKQMFMMENHYHQTITDVKDIKFKLMNTTN